MGTLSLLAKFARIGARLKVVERPSRPFRVASGTSSLDIREDRAGEFFEVVRQPGVPPDVALLDVHWVLMNTESEAKAMRNVVFLD